MVHIGSRPETKFRGDPAIFGALVEDHDLHRRLIAQIAETEGDSAERRALFEELTKEIKAHAAAEEQALWSTVLRKPEVTEDGRHAVAEHKELDDMLNRLAATDMSHGGWLNRFHKLKEEYLHHIREEEQEQFLAAETYLSKEDLAHMAGVFRRRKTAEKAAAKMTPKRKPEH